MSMIKYSIGQITSVEDKDGIEEREDAGQNMLAESSGNLVVCNKCGLQHMVMPDENRVCCGNVIRTN